MSVGFTSGNLLVDVRALVEQLLPEVQASQRRAIQREADTLREAVPEAADEQLLSRVDWRKAVAVAGAAAVGPAALVDDVGIEATEELEDAFDFAEEAWF